MAMEQPAPGVAAAHHTGHDSGEDDSSDWQEHADHGSAALTGMGQTGQTWEEEDDGGSRAALQNAWMDYENRGAENGSNGVGLANGDDDDWAERIKRSSWGTEESAEAPSAGSDATAGVGDPEIAIRQALKNALEQPEEPAAVEPARTGPVNADPFQDFWQGFASGPDGEEGQGLDDRRADVIAAQIENVRRSSVLYDASALRDGYTGDEDGASDPAIQSDIATAFKQEAPQKRTPTRPEYRHDQSLTDYDAADGEGAEGEYGADYLNGDAAALQAELENFGHMSYDEPRRGGLALVAAWAVFLSIISGVTLAFVNFRDDIMASLPGTTRLYSAIGFDIADRQVDFSNVGYRWTLSGDKPMLEVKGQIVNTTDHEVDVPRVLITVRDARSSDGVKAIETVRTQPLAARETALFTLEFVSPSKTVSQVELEFDSAR